MNNLVIQVLNEKDATGIEKRVIISTLKTDIPGMERITAVSELDDKCRMGKEIDDLIGRMMEAKRQEMRTNSDAKINKKLKKK